MSATADSTSDVRVITSGRRTIHAHSGVLALSSPVLERMLDQQATRRVKFIAMIGVPSEAVDTFVRLLCSGSSSGPEDEEEMGLRGMQLLALAHAYRVGWMKRACEAALAARLKVETVVDVLQLARMCDAPGLGFRCLRFVAREFAAVEQTEAWGFVQNHDPWLELEVLQYIQEVEQRQKRTRRKGEAQKMYQQLSEAMECLDHLTTEGCRYMNPYSKELPQKSEAHCTYYITCQRLQFLLRHSTTCSKKLGCARCGRLRRLLRLHSTICDRSEICRVPFCKQLKLRYKEMEGKGGDKETWKLLAKKVASVKAMSSFIRRKMPKL